jgi:hypothetical protein
VLVRWRAPDGAEAYGISQYEIECSKATHLLWRQCGKVQVHFHREFVAVIGQLRANETYIFRVRALSDRPSSGGCSPCSDPIYVTGGVPATPTNVLASVLSDRLIRVSACAPNSLPAAPRTLLRCAAQSARASTRSACTRRCAVLGVCS